MCIYMCLYSIVSFTKEKEDKERIERMIGRLGGKKFRY